jgi:hypothetical protein
VGQNPITPLWNAFGHSSFSLYTPPIPDATQVDQNGGTKHKPFSEVMNDPWYKWVKGMQSDRPLLPPVQTMEKVTPNGHVTDLPNVGELPNGKHEVQGKVINEVETINFRVYNGDTTILNSTRRNDTTTGTIIYKVETKANPRAKNSGTVTSHDTGKRKGQ